MPAPTKPSSAAHMAIVYITVGALTLVWTIIWRVYLLRHPPEGDLAYYFCYGFMLTGLVVLLIGLALGWIGRAARRADLPPDIPSASPPPPQPVVANGPAVAVPPQVPPQAVPVASVPAAPPPRG